MARFGFVPYSIQIRDSHADNDYVPVAKFHGQTGITDVFDEFCKTRMTDASQAVAAIDHIAQSVIRIDKHDHMTEMGSSVYSFAVISTGQYGEESDIYHSGKRQVTYKKSKDEAELIPFFTALECVSGNRERAIILFQTYKQFGMKTAFCKEFIAYFKSKFGKRYTIEISPIVPEGLISQITSLPITRVDFVRFDASDAINNLDSGNPGINANLSVSFSAKRGSFLPLNNVFAKLANRSTKEIKGYVEFPGFLNSFDYEDIYFTVKDGTIDRTVKVLEFYISRYRHDIENEVKIDPNGHPELESLKLSGFRFISRIRSQLG